ncbi:hypothetical protein [Mucisphaera calidilacus]|uniref:DUF1570 domain-containing protein n=1 Tax=Mucisphaera calidilacus TaxID=2527982 RepID=A0A518BYQ5_9BACT|nr:hypothetical protein [Mucisphaera calidilacus]QDU72109.1 hypothetical protein Pan265_19710 [Mucisphaera calidilacus]
MRWVFALLVLLGLVGVSEGAWVEVDPPRVLSVETLSGERLRGRLVGYDETLFRLLVSDDEEVEIFWEDLTAKKVLTVHRVLLRDADVEAWLRLGALLGGMPEGGSSMEVALRRAVRMDPAAADRAEAIRGGEPYVEPEAEAETASGGEGVIGGLLGGPVLSGGVEPQYWGELSPEVMAASVDELKRYVGEVNERLGARLVLQETDYFLLYTDLPGREARNWAGLLDRMYGRLCRLFEVERGRNLFRGKCLIVVFREPEMYVRYHAELYGLNAASTAGLCRMFGDGYVKVSFYRQGNEHDFAYVLVHETVHAFLHRYESPALIANWVNEGLAELIASEMVGGSDLDEARWSASTWPILRRYRSLNGMMWAANIEGWQYGAAHRLTEFMVRQDRKRYGAFIGGMKSGLSWEESLQDRYGSSVQRLVGAWGASLGLSDLRP